MGGLQWGDTVTCEARSVTQNDTKQTKPHHTLQYSLSALHYALNTELSLPGRLPDLPGVGGAQRPVLVPG